MTENIELHSFFTSVSKDSDIEEYHEINQDLIETEFSPKFTEKKLSEYDFFTEHDVKTLLNGSERKKNDKKKMRSPNLMDIISSELASAVVPIGENVISLVDYTVEQQSSYLQRTRPQRVLHKCPTLHLDSEHGWGHKQETINLSPIFPRILQNTVVEDNNIPIEYVQPVKYNDLIEHLDTDIKGTAKFLNIEIHNIKFKHHHQFSLELLLCTKLIDCIDEYNNIKKFLENLTKEIKISRETRDSLKQEFLKISPSKKEDLRFDKTLRKYTETLLKSKEKYLITLQKRKEMIHKITSLWSDIEMVRDKTKCTETPYILVMTRISLDEEEFSKEWNEAFDREFADMLDRMEHEYVTKYIEYKEVKNTQNLDDSTKKRISKPKLQIDEDALKEEVETVVNNIVTKDKIDVILKQNKSILSDLINHEENMQRNKYYFKIYVDDAFVCESEHVFYKKYAAPDIEFAESFSLEIVPKNYTLAVVLSENDRDVAFLKIHLSDIGVTFANAKYVQEQFVFKDIFETNAGHVGSGHNIKEIAAENKVRLKSSNIFKGNLYTACDINIKIGWNDKISQNENEAIKSSLEIARQLKRLLHGIDKPHTDTLSEIISELYVKDVRNEENIVRTLEKICKTDVNKDDTFPIDENSPEFVRLKLLHLRNIGGFNNIENKLIPAHASQISTEQLNCLQKSDENEFEVQYFNDKFSDLDPIELQRYIGSKYVQKLNRNMLRNLKEHLLRKTHKDVVRDFKDLSIRSLFTNKASLPTLANISNSTKQQLLSEALGKEQEIRITVFRAFNLLDRNVAVLAEDEGNEDHIAGFKVRPLRPFVKLNYRGAAAQTVTAIGCHPTWNQTVKIKVRPDPLSSIHMNIYDEHKVNVTERLSDDEQRKRSNTAHYRYYNKWLGTVHVPLHTVLTLGSFRGTFKVATPPLLFGYENKTHSKESSQSLIPSIIQLMKKDTTCISVQITTTLSHLGGLQEYSQPIPNSEDDYLINHLNTFVRGYLNNFPSRNISLTFIDSSGQNKCVTQFLQPIPVPNYELFPKNPKNLRSESALSKSSGLSKSSSSSGRRKDESERVEYQSGERDSQYSGQEGGWRNGGSRLVNMIDMCLRYVSLIPTYEVTESHTVTLLGVELLKVLHGSPLDHTLLLASYFLHLGIRCWVAIGMGLPRGRSSYVLTKYDLTTRRVVLLSDQPRSRGFLNKSDGYVWYVYDGSTAERSELRDVGCPLKTVDYVFDNDNIWVNVQSSQDCESVVFDFTKTSDWQPVLDSSVFVMKAPLIADALLYSRAADTTRLRDALDARLRLKVQKWRPHVNTIWNRYCSTLLREMLPHWEFWAFNPTEPKPALSQRLKQLMGTYKMYGFPLNMAYVSTRSVVSAVKATATHALDDPDAEFALAVEVFAYPNNVLSVWVFLATIARL